MIQIRFSQILYLHDYFHSASSISFICNCFKMYTFQFSFKVLIYFFISIYSYLAFKIGFVFEILQGWLFFIYMFFRFCILMVIFFVEAVFIFCVIGSRSNSYNFLFSNSSVSTLQSLFFYYTLKNQFLVEYYYFLFLNTDVQF